MRVIGFGVIGRQGSLPLMNIASMATEIEIDSKEREWGGMGATF